MKREIKIPYTIKLVFEKDTESPSRLFNASADIINAIHKFDNIIAKSINSEMSSKLFLNDIEKGSIITTLSNWLFLDKPAQLDTIKNNNDISKFTNESQKAMLNSIKNKDNDVISLVEKIDNIAESNNIKNTLNYSKPDVIEITKTINEISNSTKKLNANEKFIISNENETDGIEIDNTAELIDIEQIEKNLTKKTIENIVTLCYKIKKPDFLGDSQWEFKHGAKFLKAKINDDVWISDFHKGNFIVKPGDSLKVRAKSISNYSQSGSLISEKIEIIEVLEVISN